MGFTALCSGIGLPGTWHTDACLRQPRGQPANTVTRAILKRKTHGPTAVQSAIVAEGTPLHAVKKCLEREGVPAPKGGKYWSRSYIRRVVKEDSYKPHLCEEIESLVTPEVPSTLDRSKNYGIWWFNQYHAPINRGRSLKFSRKPRE